jgi:hypothetical protein
MSGLRLTEATPQKKSAVEKLREILNSNEGGVQDVEVVLKLDTPDIRGQGYSNEVLGVENTDPFGSLDIENHVIGLLVDNGLTNESELREAVAEGYDLTQIKGIGKVTANDILDALRTKE